MILETGIWYHKQDWARSKFVSRKSRHDTSLSCFNVVTCFAIQDNESREKKKKSLYANKTLFIYNSSAALEPFLLLRYSIQISSHHLTHPELSSLSRQPHHIVQRHATSVHFLIIPNYPATISLLPPLSSMSPFLSNTIPSTPSSYFGLWSQVSPYFPAHWQLSSWPAVWFLRIQYAHSVDTIWTVSQPISSRDAGWEKIYWAQRLWQEIHGPPYSSWFKEHMCVYSLSQLLRYHDHSQWAWHDQLPRNLHQVVLNLPARIQSVTLTGGPGAERDVSWIQVTEYGTHLWV